MKHFLSSVLKLDSNSQNVNNDFSQSQNTLKNLSVSLSHSKFTSNITTVTALKRPRGRPPKYSTPTALPQQVHAVNQSRASVSQPLTHPRATNSQLAPPPTKRPRGRPPKDPNQAPSTSSRTHPHRTKKLRARRRLYAHEVRVPLAASNPFLPTAREHAAGQISIVSRSISPLDGDVTFLLSRQFTTKDGATVTRKLRVPVAEVLTYVPLREVQDLENAEFMKSDEDEDEGGLVGKEGARGLGDVLMSGVGRRKKVPQAQGGEERGAEVRKDEKWYVSQRKSDDDTGEDKIIQDESEIAIRDAEDASESTDSVFSEEVQVSTPRKLIRSALVAAALPSSSESEDELDGTALLQQFQGNTVSPGSSSDGTDDDMRITQSPPQVSKREAKEENNNLPYNSSEEDELNSSAILQRFQGTKALQVSKTEDDTLKRVNLPSRLTSGIVPGDLSEDEDEIDSVALLRQFQTEQGTHVDHRTTSASEMQPVTQYAQLQSPRISLSKPSTTASVSKPSTSRPATINGHVASHARRKEAPAHGPPSKHTTNTSRVEPTGPRQLDYYLAPADPRKNTFGDDTTLRPSQPLKSNVRSTTSTSSRVRNRIPVAQPSTTPVPRKRQASDTSIRTEGNRPSTLPKKSKYGQLPKPSSAALDPKLPATDHTAKHTNKPTQPPPQSPQMLLQIPRHRIERILDDRTVRIGTHAHRELLVKWAGHANEYTSWEWEDSIEDAAGLLEQSRRAPAPPASGTQHTVTRAAQSSSRPFGPDSEEGASATAASHRRRDREASILSQESLGMVPVPTPKLRRRISSAAEKDRRADETMRKMRERQENKAAQAGRFAALMSDEE